MAHILVIDDDFDVRATLVDLLESKAYEVTQADNPVSGFSALEQRCPDLILIDLSFPGLRGENFIRWVRLSHAFAHIPIIVVSGLGDQSDVEEAMTAGANAYFVKPVSDSKLLQDIALLLNK
jgi:CheY-like chemotaxis protein